MQSLHTSRAASRRGLLLIMLAAVLWGTVGISTKTIYQITAINPLSIGFFRLAFSLPVLFSVCWARLGRKMFQVSRTDLGLMMLVGAHQKQPWVAFALLFVGSGLWLVRCLIDLGMARRHIERGGIEYAQSLLEQSLGKEKASQIRGWRDQAKR